MSEEVISIIFPQHLRVAGDLVQGEVQLNFKQLQHSRYERVQAKLRGAVFTKVARAVGYAQNTSDESVILVDETTVLWQQGEAYPPPGSDVLKLPFRFVLPTDGLLPSCEFDNKLDLSAKVIYWVEVLGFRTGAFHLNKRIPCIFPVLPPDIIGAELSHVFRLGWTGPWRSLTDMKQIRKGMWGGYGSVRWTFTIPDTEAFPIMTPIPFALHIITISKPVKRDEPLIHDSIFPAPPTTPHTGIELKLMRNVYVRANYQDGESFSTLIDHLGGFGPEPTQIVHTDVKDHVWEPCHDGHNEKKHLGTWKQEVVFRSHFAVQCAPTFQSRTMRIDYNLQVKIDFPGVGNNVRGLYPVRFVSNMPATGSDSWEGPPPELDLPPTYYVASEYHTDNGTVK